MSIKSQLTKIICIFIFIGLTVPGLNPAYCAEKKKRKAKISRPIKLPPPPLLLFFADKAKPRSVVDVAQPNGEAFKNVPYVLPLGKIIKIA